MLNYMGSIVGGVMNLLSLYCMADVTNIDILEITKKKKKNKPSWLDFCYPDVLKTWQQSTPKSGIKNG